MNRIAIVGMACRYPDATSPRELWENALAARRAFRRLPDVRMRLEDYWDADPSAPDRFYSRNAAVIEGYEFDRIAYKVAGSTYRATDLTHWLALDMAAMALADAGFPMAEGLPRERTGVVVGNTLTGEFTRANQMRLRWPYVRRMVAAALKEQDWDDDHLASFLDSLEARYKHPFPPVDEDTLAGSLSNTIAGRICNHFDLKGGGFTVDGACSSSLLSIATAGKALIDGELDVAIAGGVDLSIDPFEIVGFAKTGALARGEMRVYDSDSNGFWPGEGCGMVVLMREQEAVAVGHRIYATIAGWGISSDGKGGITRPEVSGYQLALRRAYERAGFGIETVALFEGHGTGTRVGDAIELEALTRVRKMADPAAPPAAIGSVKAMIGHTKAAAGVAGLIKAAMAVHNQVLPPTIGCVDPHELLTREDAALRVLRKAEPWPDGVPMRAGITGMGFGGINTHVVLEKTGVRRRSKLDTRTAAVASSAQDVELLLVDGGSPAELRERVARLIDFVPMLAYAQLADLAVTLHRELRDLPFRAAVVVASPEDAQQRLRRVADALDAGETRLFTSDGRCFLGHVTGRGRIGFLFPGQGSGRGTSGGALRQRFAEVEEVYERANLPAGGDTVATAVAQPRIVTGSMAGMRTLSTLGIEATVAVGHSLGEISALHWAGALEDETLLEVARLRGQTMAAHSTSGTMASLAVGPDVAKGLIGDEPVVIAAYNGPSQVAVAGSVDALRAVAAKAADADVACTMLPVSHAFHSPLVAPAAGVFAERLADYEFGPVGRRVVSTVTGEVLPPDTDVPALLHRQITDPVLFVQAIALAAKDIDLFVEVGPGRVLTGLATAGTDVPAVALDTDDESLAGLLHVVGAAYVVGAAGVHPALFHGRLTRPLHVGAEFRFFASPCETAPAVDLPHARTAVPVATATAVPAEALEQDASTTPASTLELLRRLAAERAELPLDLVRDDSLLLDELHLSSITVGQVMNQVAREIGLPPAQAPTNFASATVKALADALDELSLEVQAGDFDRAAEVAGAGMWVRAFAVDLDRAELATRPAAEADDRWQVYAYGDHPLAEPLRQALERGGVGGGVAVCLPPECTEQQLELALFGARTAIGGPRGSRFVLVQHGRGATGLAKTLRLEAPHLRVTVVQTPQVPEAVGRVVDEVAATVGYLEAHYDADGVRRVPVLRAMPVSPAREQRPLDATDVLLVTGGGKGITAESALALATDSGARLAVLGRSDPDSDPELAANLKRMADAGLQVRYARADVTDVAQVRDAVRHVTEEFGHVTAILHGAGRNEPAALTALDLADFRRTFASKVDGLQAVLDAVEPERLRLLVTFGSIIGRAGLRGEAHYATANDWLAELTREFAARYPRCRVHCVEWSVWSGVGMGERLSVVESLSRDGVMPISPDLGVQALRRLLADPETPTVVVVSGRTRGIDTVRYERPDLPMLRFLGRPLVYYDGIELVTEVELNAGTDLYLADHRLDGNLLFPAVFGLEAMAQVAGAVTGRTEVPVIEEAEFLQPIVVPPDGTTTIRIAAVVTGNDTVDVAIHSEETNFAAEHFRARLRYGDGDVPDGPPGQVPDGHPAVLLDPAADLYGDLMFQGGRFHRLRTYHRAAARDVDAEVAALDSVGWFASYLPGTLVLGDPGVRDALMHGNQVCVPNATLLPERIARVYPAGGRLSGNALLRFCATERAQEGNSYVYDIVLRNGTGEVVERWEGLRLRAVRVRDGRGPWVPALLGPYLERSVGDLYGGRVAVAVHPDGSDRGHGSVDARRARTATAAVHVFGRPVRVRYRPDGRPEVDADGSLSAAHGVGVTLCVAGPGTVGCDIEAIRSRSAADWAGLLGRHSGLAELVAAELGEPADTAATRVWTAIECLQKAGQSTEAPLALLPGEHGPWVVFSSGELRIATLATTLRDVVDPVVCAILGNRLA
jgi:enediyne polyketide synthase